MLNIFKVLLSCQNQCLFY